MTSFYRHLEGNCRRFSWNLIQNLYEVSNLLWCIMGDFNELLLTEEKKGSVEMPNWLIRGLRQVVQDTDLLDVSMEGYPFKWFKNLGTDRVVKEKIDRAMTNSDWCMLFSEAKVKCLTTTTSDHYPILLCCETSSMLHKPTKRFRFENAWLIELDFQDFVIEKWHKNEMDGIVGKLELCCENMMKWSKYNCHQIRKEIENISRNIERVRHHVGEGNINYFLTLKRCMNSLLVKEDMFWNQREKVHWFKDGDLSARFFHISATARKKVNIILYLTKDNGGSEYFKQRDVSNSS
ncbi:unnamed protein product [Lathyrus sativus]|nr:unnamed protein product [Lathyrus sativus]